jgi:histidinol dehydrogenase
MTQPRLAVKGTLADLPAATLARLTNRRSDAAAAVATSVRAIVERVRREGDSALLDLAQELDGVHLAALEVPREEWRRALGALPSQVLNALERAAANITCAHTAWRPRRAEVEVEPGVCITRRPEPLSNAGVYAPGGRASYPSSVLMGVIPARVAGVPEVILCSPPGSTGQPSDAVLAAAEIAGADRVYAVGGAAAIAAMALGTESIPRVDCIVGPGNAYVTEAKLQLMRSVRTDLPAGPSEILIIADESADLCGVAAELGAQAEHGGDSSAIAVVIGGALAERLHAALASTVSVMPRAETVYEALANTGAVLEARSLDEALAFAESYAPEHLLIATRNAADVAERVRNAGSVFVGLTSSVAFGDYITGANHVLPTAGYARAYSGLSTETFMRWTTVQTVTGTAAQRLAPLTAAFATAEGLAGHATAALRAGATQ